MNARDGDGLAAGQLQQRQPRHRVESVAAGVLVVGRCFLEGPDQPVELTLLVIGHAEGRMGRVGETSARGLRGCDRIQPVACSLLEL
ncbi:MAG: hypothetical protein IIC99_00125 [Chloroflexi bacterium]|nr:hypothetical protein [Chloroflexota bacterium]